MTDKHVKLFKEYTDKFGFWGGLGWLEGALAETETERKIGECLEYLGQKLREEIQIDLNKRKNH